MGWRPRCWFGLVLLAALSPVMAALSPVMAAAEPEIYVTTGPDGVEVYSNLPRKPSGGRGTAASGNPDAVQMLSLASQGPREEGAPSHTVEPGKSFLLDD